MNPTIKIAIADDHKLMRDSLIVLANSITGFQVTIEACNGDDLINQLRKSERIPDICLLDISMPKKNGYEVMKTLMSEWPELRVLVISMIETEYSVLQMLQLGAKGYLNKNFTSIEQLKEAIKSVVEKNYYHSEAISSKTFKALSHGISALKISEQEMNFLKYACTDLCYADIAKKMGISKRTVEGYRDSLFQKLDIKSRHSLSVFALQNGLISMEELNKSLVV